MTKRSRFGCQTCKIRRVKCDETQPYCKRCTETGRRCEGPSKNKTIFMVPTRFQRQRQQFLKSDVPASHSPRDSPIEQLVPNLDLQANSSRALSFFAERAGPALGAELDRAFWHVLVLQLCHANTMVRNAVLALSTLCENPLSDPLQWPTTIEVNFSRSEHRQAFKWYGQSLNSLPAVLYRAQDKESLHLALTSCLLFACIEIQQLNVGNSMALMRCGYNLLSQEATRSIVSQSPLIRGVLLPIFIRQTIVLTLHGYPLPTGWLPVNRDELFNDSSPISSFQEARTQLFLLMLDATLVITGSHITFDSDGVARLRDAQSAVLARFALWRSRLKSFISTQIAPSAVETRIVSLLWSYYLVTTTWLSACLHDELVYDIYTPQFGEILDHIETLLSKTNQDDAETLWTYTFEMRTVPPLYFVGWKCRNPRIRRRALQLLKRAPSQESLFHRDVEIWALRKIIQIEENLQSVEGSNVTIEDVEGCVPAEADRLRHVLVRWDVHDGKKSEPCLVYSQWAMIEDERGQLKTIVAPL